MKRLIVILAFTAAAFGALIVPNTQSRKIDNTNIVTTAQLGYIDVSNVSSDATDLTTTTKHWDNIDTTGGSNDANVPFIPIPPEWNVVELSLYGYGDGTGAGSPADANFVVHIYAVRQYGNARKVYEGACLVGAQQMSRNPVTGAALNSGSRSSSYCWADTIDPNGTGDTWISTVTVTDNDGSNGIATISFDMNGYWGIYVIIRNMTSELVTTVYAVASGY